MAHTTGMPDLVRAKMENALGADFSDVRVQTESPRALALRALAFTQGNEIHVAPGHWTPETVQGQELLGHELGHVLQQRAGRVRRTTQLAGAGLNDDPALEREAAALGARAAGAAGENRSAGTVRPVGTPVLAGGPIQRQQAPPTEQPLVSDDALLACLALAPLPLKPLCFEILDSGAGGRSSPAPAPGATPRSPAPPAPPVMTFFHGSTWRIAQTIPGNVQPIGGGDFGQGFYTHHDADTNRAEDRARFEGCRLCQKMSPSERYAGVIRFDVATADYRSLFSSRKTFGLTSTTQADYAARQRAWLDFVSGAGRGREAAPVYDAAHMAWRHQRVDPPPDQGYSLIEGPMYKGVAGLPGSSVPPRSAFDPYAEGTALPQQVVWNHPPAMRVLNAAPTTLRQFDATKQCLPVDPPVSVPPLTVSIAEDPRASEEARIALTGH